MVHGSAALTFLAELLLARSTLEGPVAIVAVWTVGHSLCGTLAVADEVQDYLHLLSEAQRFNFNGLTLVVCRTLLSFNGNLESHLETTGEFMGPVEGLQAVQEAARS